MEPVASTVQPDPPAQFALWLLGADDDDGTARDLMPQPIAGAAGATFAKLASDIRFARAAVTVQRRDVATGDPAIGKPIHRRRGLIGPVERGDQGGRRWRDRSGQVPIAVGT